MQNKFETVSDEVLMAYADDALDAGERRRVQAALSADPDLIARLEPFILTRSALPEIFSEALTSPVPDRLTRTVMTAPMPAGAKGKGAVSGSLLARVRAFLIPEIPSFGNAVALAAIVAVLGGAGWMAQRALSPAVPGTSVAVNDNTPIAEGALASALEMAPVGKSITVAGMKASAVNTFFDKSGRICREYGLEETGKDAIAGFACRREDGRWQIGFHGPAAASSGAPADENVPAAGQEPNQSLDSALENAKAGDVLSVEEDAALIANGWRKP